MKRKKGVGKTTTEWSIQEMISNKNQKRQKEKKKKKKEMVKMKVKDSFFYLS